MKQASWNMPLLMIRGLEGSQQFKINNAFMVSCKSEIVPLTQHSSCYALIPWYSLLASKFVIL